MSSKRVKVRIPGALNQKGGPIDSKQDKKKKSARRTTRAALKRNCWED